MCKFFAGITCLFKEILLFTTCFHKSAFWEKNTASAMNKKWTFSWNIQSRNYGVKTLMVKSEKKMVCCSYDCLRGMQTQSGAKENDFLENSAISLAVLYFSTINVVYLWHVTTFSMFFVYQHSSASRPAIQNSCMKRRSLWQMLVKKSLQRCISSSTQFVLCV